MKCVVINVHAALGEVSCVQVGLAIDEGAGQARVARSVGGFDHGHSMRRRRCGPLSYSNSWVPPGNRPINRGEEEWSWFAWGQEEICLTSVKDGAGWCTRWRVLVSGIRRRDCDDQRLLDACAIVQRT